MFKWNSAAPGVLHQSWAGRPTCSTVWVSAQCRFPTAGVIFSLLTLNRSLLTALEQGRISASSVVVWRSVEGHDVWLISEWSMIWLSGDQLEMLVGCLEFEQVYGSISKQNKLVFKAVKHRLSRSVTLPFPLLVQHCRRCIRVVWINCRFHLYCLFMLHL